MQIFGKRNTLSFEIGEFDSENKNLRVIDIWSANVLLTPVVHDAYLPQFLASLERSYTWLTSANAAFMTTDITCVTDAIRRHQQLSVLNAWVGDHAFLQLGPTTDACSCYVFGHDDMVFLTSCLNEHEEIRVAMMSLRMLQQLYRSVIDFLSAHNED